VSESYSTVSLSIPDRQSLRVVSHWIWFHSLVCSSISPEHPIFELTTLESGNPSNGYWESAN
jgi:hypothetical protein